MYYIHLAIRELAVSGLNLDVIALILHVQSQVFGAELPSKRKNTDTGGKFKTVGYLTLGLSLVVTGVCIVFISITRFSAEIYFTALFGKPNGCSPSMAMDKRQ